MLTAAIFASKLADIEEMGHKEFMAFIAAYGRDYKDMEEMVTRRQIFDQAKEVVKNLNDTIQGAKFKMNHFADMTSDEKEEMRRAGEPMRESAGKHF